MDKRGEKCSEVDEAVVPSVPGQRGALAVVRPGLQPGERATAAGAAAVDPQLEPDGPAREADQDRGEGRDAREVRRVPVGGGGGAPAAVRGACGADRPVAAGSSLGVRFAVTDKAA